MVLSATNFAEFQECLKSSKRIIALVGAGLSASSGLPIFRGSQGLWKNFNMIDLATPDAFYIDPGLVWQFYSWRRHQALQAQPNAGHLALAKLSKNPDIDFVTITQNVDGLSGRAGHKTENLHEIHGSLFELRCTSFTCTYIDRDNTDDPLTPALDETNEYEHMCERKRSQANRNRDPDLRIQTGTSNSLDRSNLSDLELHDPRHTISDPSSISPETSPQFAPTKELAIEELPLCPACRSLMRPGVVWFGESLPLRALGEIDDFLEDGLVDLILVIGTSGTVYPANSYVELVRSRGGSVAIFNTDIDQDVLAGKVARTWGFQGDAAEWLPRALDCLDG